MKKFSYLDNYLGYLESQGAEHTTAVSGTDAGLVTVDVILVGRSGTGDFGADRVNAPAVASLRITLYLFEFASLIVASRHELRRALGTESPRSPHGRQC